MLSLCSKFIGVNKVCVLSAYQVFKPCYSLTSEDKAASRWYLRCTDEEAGAQSHNRQLTNGEGCPGQEARLV